MKSKELIEELQKLDPEGEVDVTIGNEPIYYLDSLPAYYDGRMGRLIHDEDKKGKAWSITGYEITGKGHKIKIVSRGWSDLLWDMPDLKIIYDGEYIDSGWIEKYRSYVKESLAEIHKDSDYEREIRKLRETEPPAGKIKYFGLFQNWRYIKYSLSNLVKTTKSIWRLIKYKR